jgi:hypothetical protein
VYTITPTRITEAPGSPYSIQTEKTGACSEDSFVSCPNSLVVVPKL